VRDAYGRAERTWRYSLIALALVFGIGLMGSLRTLSPLALGLAPLVFLTVAVAMWLAFTRAAAHRVGAVQELARRHSGQGDDSSDATTAAPKGDTSYLGLGTRFVLPVAGLGFSVFVLLALVAVIIVGDRFDEWILIVTLAVMSLAFVFLGWLVVAVLSARREPKARLAASGPHAEQARQPDAH